MVKAEDYRKSAELCLKKAEQALTPGDRAHWLEMAQVWHKLADNVEQKIQKSAP